MGGGSLGCPSVSSMDPSCPMNASLDSDLRSSETRSNRCFWKWFVRSTWSTLMFQWGVNEVSQVVPVMNTVQERTSPSNPNSHTQTKTTQMKHRAHLKIFQFLPFSSETFLHTIPLIFFTTSALQKKHAHTSPQT